MQFQYETDNLILRILEEGEYAKVLDFYTKGDAYFGALEPDRAPGFFTDSYQRYVLKCEYNMFLTERSARYYIFTKENPDVVIGTVSLRDMRKDNFCSATVGYKMLEEFTGRGYCTEAVKCVTEASFAENGIHRVYAYVQPDNIGSIKVLENSGFEREGLVRDYVQLNGKWLDHLMYGKISNWME